MKKLLIIKLSILGLVLVVLASCTKNITSLNDNPKGPVVVPGESLISQAQANLANYYTTPDVNTNIFELIMQYWAETTYPQESQYILSERNIPRFWWQAMYTGILKNLETGKQLIAVEDVKPIPGAQDPAVRTNKVAITEISEIYVWAMLVNTFGNIPYTEALDFTKATPKYDDQKTVFYALTDSLDAALARLDPSVGSFGSADLLYGGTVSSWIKFANSLKLRMGMQLADIDPAKAQTMVEAAAPNAFASNTDNALFNFLSTPPNTNPIWTNLVQSNRNDFVPTNTLVNQMNAGSDPRLSSYFTTVGGVYIGGVSGNGNTYANFSHVSDPIKVATFPTLLLDFSEVQFLKAEAVERGFNVGGATAISHYDSAVTASITYWGGSATDAVTYLAQPGVSYTTATWQERIGVQQWIALYLRGFDAWTSWRRLGWPKIVAPASAITPTPVRFTYPDNEQTLNQANWQAASAAIGGDLVTTKLFWMK
jgi:hypothetical protein